jgi:CheY-like chemotaxis protein
MREETMQKIFDPLFTTKVTGRGLGLATLLNAVERHNGTVEVQSNPGQGTVFRVYFPAEEGQGSGVEAAALRDEPREWRGNGTVLVADDEPAIQAMTRALLERVGFRVLTASDGMEAVDLCTEHAEEITLLLIDINMPRLSGMEAVLRIRYTIPRIPVLFMSGYSRDEVMGRFGRQPHTDFVQKPFRSDDLVSAIRRVMEPG